MTKDIKAAVLYFHVLMTKGSEKPFVQGEPWTYSPEKVIKKPRKYLSS